MSGPLLASPPPSHTEPQGRESPEGENDLFLWQEDLPGPVRIPRGPSPTPSWAAPPRSAASSRASLQTLNTVDRSQRLPPYRSTALTTLSEPVAVQPDAQPAGACAEPTTASSNMGMSNVKMPAPVRKPIRDWSEEDVSVFLMNLSTVPMDIIDVVHAHAITGAVLLSLTDEDLEGLNIEKFGHRRLLLLAAQELRRTVQAERSAGDPGMISPSSSLGSAQVSQPRMRLVTPSSAQVRLVGTQSVPVAPGMPRSVPRSWIPQAAGAHGGAVPMQVVRRHS